jgi:predicted acyltransferase
MSTPDLPTAPRRLSSIDAYRGLVMLLMMAEVLHFCAVARAIPGDRAREKQVWETLCYHQSHVEWVGCSLHDLIQPSFSFLVGVALPFSLASRRARGQSAGRMTLHAAWRALVLIALGIFLRSIGKPQTYYTFEDTLTQIGLGYLFLFALGFRPARDQVVALVLILIGYWAAFALLPLPGTDFPYSKVGVPSDWPHLSTGFTAHWNKNSNAAWKFDRWFLNLFPRERPFEFNGGGYATLSFIPTLGTMILGLLAGDLLRGDRRPGAKVGTLIGVGILLLAAGWGLGAVGVCPVVKRIWTPSWTLFSGGWCFVLLAGFYRVLDGHEAGAGPLVRIATLIAAGLLLFVAVWGLEGWSVHPALGRIWMPSSPVFRGVCFLLLTAGVFGVLDALPGRAWAFPLIVVGMNSIAAYCLAHLIEGFLVSSFKTHLGPDVFLSLGKAYAPLLQGACVLLLMWLILLWMYGRRLFLRI